MLGLTIFEGFGFSEIFWIHTLKIQFSFFTPFYSPIICSHELSWLSVWFPAVSGSFQAKSWRNKDFCIFKNSYLGIHCFYRCNQLITFHYFSHVSSKYTYFNAFPSSKACFLEVSANLNHTKWKIKTSNYGSVQFFNFWNWAKIASNP